MRKPKPQQLRGIHPECLYHWPSDVRYLTGLGMPSLYRLLLAGLEVRQLGRQSFVNGSDLIEAIWREGKPKVITDQAAAIGER